MSNIINSINIYTQRAWYNHNKTTSAPTEEPTEEPIPLTSIWWKVEDTTLYLRNDSAEGYEERIMYKDDEESRTGWFNHPNKINITTCIIENEITPTYMTQMFTSMHSLTTFVNFEKLKTNECRSMRRMFYDCQNIMKTTKILDLSGWDVSKVTDMSYMFCNCFSLTSLEPIANWDVSNVTSMTSMFYGCGKLTSLDLSNWDVSKVTNMSYMFRNCSSLTSLEPIANWNVSKVTNMSYMFIYCSSLTSLEPIANWNVSKVTNMSYMFQGCSSLTSLEPIANWNVSKVTNMSYMFIYCSSLTSLDLSNWDVSKVTNMSYMFGNCFSLTSLEPIANWDVSNVTSMTGMFYGCSKLTSLEPIANWDVSNVTSMTSMFYGCGKLTSLDLSNWDVSKVTDTQSMFYSCTNLTSLDLSNWDLTTCSNYVNTLTNCTSLRTITANNITQKTYDIIRYWLTDTSLHDVYFITDYKPPTEPPVTGLSIKISPVINPDGSETTYYYSLKSTSTKKYISYYNTTQENVDNIYNATKFVFKSYWPNTYHIWFTDSENYAYLKPTESGTITKDISSEKSTFKYDIIDDKLILSHYNVNDNTIKYIENSTFTNLYNNAVPSESYTFEVFETYTGSLNTHLDPNHCKYIFAYSNNVFAYINGNIYTNANVPSYFTIEYPHENSEFAYIRPVASNGKYDHYSPTLVFANNNIGTENQLGRQDGHNWLIQCDNTHTRIYIQPVTDAGSVLNSYIAENNNLSTSVIKWKLIEMEYDKDE